MYVAHITLLSVLCVISEQTTFNKANQGITDITVHTIPAATTIVWFGSNSILYIPANYFKNLLNLDEVWLNRNSISNISDSAFSQVPTVTVISLQYNQFTVIREMMFSGLPNLAMLWLSFNQIHTIQSGSFKENVALTMLSLRANSLKTISPHMFDPYNVDNHPTNLTQLKLHGNALDCNTLCWLRQAEASGWISVAKPSITKCAGPASLNGTTWDSLTDQDLCFISG